MRAVHRPRESDNCAIHLIYRMQVQCSMILLWEDGAARRARALSALELCLSAGLARSDGASDATHPAICMIHCANILCERGAPTCRRLGVEKSYWR